MLLGLVIMSLMRKHLTTEQITLGKQNTSGF
jgi:hypothetical protein